MVSQENSSGKPLADANWLEIHHRAKLPERSAFARRLANLHPKSIVDLGCASGLWLDLLNQYIPSDCAFIGIDSDKESINLAKHRSEFWNRESNFMQMDLEKLFTDGFSTENCSMREPQSISSYGMLAIIAIASNQKDQSGEQSIPAFDYYMAPRCFKDI